MGVGLGNRCRGGSSYDLGPAKIVTPPNPDPKNFQVKNHWQIGRYLIVEITYPGCTTFEGNKILLYKDCNLQQLLAQGSADPHFSANPDYYSPVARFVPTAEGLRMASLLAERFSQREQDE